MDCKYRDKKCRLLLPFKVRARPENVCGGCKPNDGTAQVTMLKRFGINMPEPRKDKDLLEWAEECVKNGTIKMTPQVEQAQKQAEAMAQLPPWFAQVGNLRRHAIEIAAHKIKTGRILVAADHKMARLEACDDCEKLLMNPKTGKKICQTCGCNVVELIGGKYGKADFVALRCENKGRNWIEVDERYRLATEVTENAEKKDKERLSREGAKAQRRKIKKI